MKKILFFAVVCLLAGGVISPAFAQKKGKKGNTETVEQPKAVVITTSQDSLSYAAGAALTNGLEAFLKQQMGVDSTQMADFLRGYQDVLKAGDNPQQKAYSAGMQIAYQTRDQMLPGVSNEFKDGTTDTINADLFYAGFMDAVAKRVQGFDSQQSATNYFNERRNEAVKAKEEKKWGDWRRQGEQFLSENAKKEGVVTRPSGLQYKIIEQGTGKVAGENDKVTVKYEGKLIDGTVFDSSYKRDPQTSDFRPSQVIAGWTEALTLMPEGSTWELYIPYTLGYGDRQAGNIKPYSVLIFKVELVKVN